MEVLYRLDISFEIGYISNDDYLEFRKKIETIAKLLSGLSKSQIE